MDLIWIYIHGLKKAWPAVVEDASDMDALGLNCVGHDIIYWRRGWEARTHKVLH